jgi:hypothetical protein
MLMYTLFISTLLGDGWWHRWDRCCFADDQLFCAQEYRTKGERCMMVRLLDDIQVTHDALSVSHSISL